MHHITTTKLKKDGSNVRQQAVTLREWPDRHPDSWRLDGAADWLDRRVPYLPPAQPSSDKTPVSRPLSGMSPRSDSVDGELAVTVGVGNGEKLAITSKNTLPLKTFSDCKATC